MTTTKVRLPMIPTWHFASLAPQKVWLPNRQTDGWSDARQTYQAQTTLKGNMILFSGWLAETFQSFVRRAWRSSSLFRRSSFKHHAVASSYQVTNHPHFPAVSLECTRLMSSEKTQVWMYQHPGWRGFPEDSDGEPSTSGCRLSCLVSQVFGFDLFA